MELSGEAGAQRAVAAGAGEGEEVGAELLLRSVGYRSLVRNP